MADAGRSLLPRHPRRLRPSFVLTSLIDVIFLLVIFFMVTSQVTPFSVIRLGPLALSDGTPGAASPPAPADARPPVAVRIQHGRIAIGGQSHAREQAASAIAALKSSGVDALLLLPAATATVQDMVTVMEAASRAGITDVSILGGARAEP